MIYVLTQINAARGDEGGIAVEDESSDSEEEVITPVHVAILQF